MNNKVNATSTRKNSQLCRKCIWNDQCGEPGIHRCDDYTSAGAGSLDYRIDNRSQMLYRHDLKERIASYDEVLKEMGGCDDYE